MRDEADVVEAQLAYHLDAGVDFVLATDHASQDGTTEILRSFERQGCLRLFRAEGEMRESEWRTRMARLAATEHGADWIINTDADEFWMPRAGTLKEALAAVPERAGVVWALTCHFVPRPDDERPFAERMTARFASPVALNDPTSPYRPHAKAAHRPDPEIVVWFGSHRVVSRRLEPLPGWHPADVLHFPFRSREQYERKNVRRALGDKPLGQYVKGLQAHEQGRLEDVYGTFVIGDEALAAGIADGSLVLDTRLRATLRGLPSAEEHGLGRFALDDAALREADVVRLVRRLDVLAARLDDVEARRWAR